MSTPSKFKSTETKSNANPRWPVATAIMAVLTAVGILIYATFANAQQPALKISNLGANQYFIEIANSVSTNYTLYWTPVLADPNYPWIVLTNTGVGESNFVIDAGKWSSGFFKVLVGDDADGDGIVEWQDAQPTNSAVGILNITIDNPLNGTTFN